VAGFIRHFGKVFDINMKKPRVHNP
jgi:hypothetical protein